MLEPESPMGDINRAAVVSEPVAVLWVHRAVPDLGVRAGDTLVLQADETSYRLLRYVTSDAAALRAAIAAGDVELNADPAGDGQAVLAQLVGPVPSRRPDGRADLRLV